MTRPALRRWPQPFAGILGSALLLGLPACAFHAPYEVHEVWMTPVEPVFVDDSPSVIPASYGAVTLVFDRELGCHRLVGRPDHYFLHDRYYRYRADHWEVSARADGPWRPSDLRRVPESLRRRHARPVEQRAAAPRPAPARERTARASSPRRVREQPPAREPERVREPLPVREPKRVREPEGAREPEPRTGPRQQARQARERGRPEPGPTRVAREESRGATVREARPPDRERPSSDVEDVRPGRRARRAVKGR